MQQIFVLTQIKNACVNYTPDAQVTSKTKTNIIYFDPHILETIDHTC